MKGFRRLVNWGSVIVLSLVALACWKVLNIRLAQTAIYTGLALYVLILILSLFNARKKVPFFPMLKASAWMRFHVILGLVSMILFLVHVDFRIPSGFLEVVLFLVFLGVTISGIVGLILSRRLPRVMNHSGEPVIYERVPRYRKEIRNQVCSLVTQAEENFQSSTLSEFYLEHLHKYLESSPSFFHTFGTEKKRFSHRLINELQARYRYLSDEEKPIAEEIQEWIETKENLDFQESAQRILRGWLFLHIPLTWSLLLLGIAHGIFALLHVGMR